MKNAGGVVIFVGVARKHLPGKVTQSRDLKLMREAVHVHVDQEPCKQRKQQVQRP